jgi:hypothetical protein
VTNKAEIRPAGGLPPQAGTEPASIWEDDELNIALRADDIFCARSPLLLDLLSSGAATPLSRLLPWPAKFGQPAFFSRRRRLTA